MRKTILGILIVLMVTTPCLAKEDDEDLFFLEGTLWRNHFVGYVIEPYPPFIFPTLSLFMFPAYFGFYQGEGFECMDYSSLPSERGEELDCDPFLIDMFICSPFVCYYLDKVIVEDGFGRWFFSFLPIGIGTFAYASGSVEEGFFYQTYRGIFIKVEDNWTPLGIE